MRCGRILCGLGLAAIVLGGAEAGSAQDIEFSGYARSLTVFQDLGYSLAGSDRRSVFNGEIVRLRWGVELGRGVRLQVHNRLQAQVSTAQQSFGAGVTGLGVSAVPGRSLDLESTFSSGDQHRIWHDIDRLEIQASVGPVDLALGRQAISWGFSNLFPVADLWAQFSPFELDTEEKRGVDAVRALIYPHPGVELDLVVADRGNRRDRSAGVRGTFELPWADVYVAGGKFWRQWMALAGISAVVDVWKLRAELGAPWSMDGGGRQALRSTIGADRLGASYSVSVEFHRNGLGVPDEVEYLRVLQSAAFGRGETYFLGRHLLGGAASYLPNDRITLGLAVLSNLDDGSASFSPSFNYDLGQHARISAGGLIGTGARPTSDAFSVALGSEFGTYGRLVYAGVGFYF